MAINNMHPSIYAMIKEKNKKDNINNYRYYIYYNSHECIIYNLNAPFKHYFVVDFKNQKYNHYDSSYYNMNNSYSFDIFNFFK